MVYLFTLEKMLKADEEEMEDQVVKELLMYTGKGLERPSQDHRLNTSTGWWGNCAEQRRDRKAAWQGENVWWLGATSG